MKGRLLSTDSEEEELRWVEEEDVDAVRAAAAAEERRQRQQPGYAYRVQPKRQRTSRVLTRAEKDAEVALAE
jgi:hypothetical protein